MLLSSKDLEAFLKNQRVEHKTIFYGETYSAEKKLPGSQNGSSFISLFTSKLTNPFVIGRVRLGSLNLNESSFWERYT